MEYKYNISCYYYAVLLAAFFIIFPITSIQAKSDFRDGYIITTCKDTIFGKIDFRSDSRNSILCIFKTGLGTNEYSPDQILGYGFINDRYFSSQILHERFVEVLVEGEISLYKSGVDIYVRKTGNEPIILESRMVRDTVEVNTPSGTDIVVGYREDLKWKQILFILTSDCTTIYQTLRHLTFNEKKILNFIINYNKCIGSQFIHYQATKKRFKIDYGIYTGIVYSTLGLENLSDQFKSQKNIYQSCEPSPGLLFAVTSPRISDKLALQIELNCIRTSFYSQIVENSLSSTEYYETYIDFSDIAVPISIRYKIPFGNSSFIFNAGTEFTLISDNNSRVYKETLSNNIVDTYLAKAVDFNKNTTGFWGGFGYLKSFKSFSIGTNLKYYHTGNMISEKGLISNLNRISISLILLVK